ncbi:MAG: hypothetical protein LRZ85_00215, partial [Alphaproteobacteria bacterium]|nr:hypothetical protein [Alphaproteobacteria bacterium]
GPSDIPVGVQQYLEYAAKIRIPAGFDPIDMDMNRTIRHADGQPEKFDKLQKFIEVELKPALAGFEDRFPYLFPATQYTAHHRNGMQVRRNYSL